ncbi:hypothetical protein EZ313_18870 [Ramlibacter henchirensis]|uniref:Uncharacterized protein n=1 Tax=Ramlibacter henchirensis TaxID=204072 RepID=A0A4Z0BMK0_9BURK|nr:hypothetical protein [Ramlibacter henchirensis]TFZ00523.1 hypothetical protein EZ313_18870 [Ramlibacter henchirensis]
MSPFELEAFETAIRDSGRDPGSFKAQVFVAAANDASIRLRRVHIVSRHAAAQYDASGGSRWTESFARHLARGFFG